MCRASSTDLCPAGARAACRTCAAWPSPRPGRAASRPTPDLRAPHRSAGATAVGARPVLVAYNVWVSSLETAQAIAPKVRNKYVRALALAVDGRAQVSCNLVDPCLLRPGRVSTTAWPSWWTRWAGKSRGPAGRADSRRHLGQGLAESLRRAGALARDHRREPPDPQLTHAERNRGQQLNVCGLPTAAPQSWRRLRGADSEAPATKKRLRGAGDVAPAGHGPGPAQPAALTLAHAAPDTELLAVGERVLQAVLAHHAAAAHLFGFPGRRPRSGKNRSGSTPMQFACNCQLRSWRP